MNLELLFGGAGVYDNVMSFESVEYVTLTTSLVVAAVLALPFLIAGPWIAAQKGRSTWEGLLLALFFGPIGLIVESCLPNKSQRYGRRTARATVVPEYREPTAESPPLSDDVSEWLEP